MAARRMTMASALYSLFFVGLLPTLGRFVVSDALMFGQPPRRHLLSYGNRETAPRIPPSVHDDYLQIGSSRYGRSHGDKQFHHNHRATKEDDTTTWSKKAPSRSDRSESRLGVRRRVRAVLAKARERTGVTNDSERMSLMNGRASLLRSDSNLGLEATTKTWSIRNGNGADDFLDSDATLSLLLAEEELSSNPTEDLFASTHPFEDQTPVNGENLNGNTVSTAYRNNNITPKVEALRRGQSTPPSPVPMVPKLESKVVSSSSTNKKESAPSSESDAQPLPFNLPSLTPEQEGMLKAGERVQEQAKMGGEGSGFVVFDVPAPEYAVWEVLLDFEAYPENIGTVRSMRMFTNKHLKQSFYSEKPLPHGATGVRHYGKACISRASFILSKFRLNIAAIHRYQPHPDGHFMVFTLDPACKNAVLRDAKGIWYTESNPAGAKEGMTRVWLLCELKVSSLLPKFIVDYAAERAMPRATTWLPSAVRRFLDGQDQPQEAKP